MRWRRSAALPTLALIISACSGSGSGGSTATTAPPTASTSASTSVAPAATTTTTLYAATGNATNDLQILSQTLGGADFSKISSSTCGDFGMVITPAAVRFFQWGASIWIEAPAQLPAISLTGPLTVTTRDYTRDSILDFLVRYGANDPHGAILVLNTVTCKWDWADMFDGSGAVKFLKDLRWTNGELKAKLYSSASGSFYDTSMVYDQPYRTFVSSAEAGT